MERYFPARQTDLALFPLGNNSRQYLLNKVLNNNDGVAVVSAVSCLRRRNLTHIGNHFKQILPRYLPDRLKSYFREIINFRTFPTGDYANRANTHRKFGTTSPQFFIKADPKIFVEDRQSINGSNCKKSFCIQCGIDSPPSCSFQARLKELGRINTRNLPFPLTFLPGMNPPQFL